VAIIDIAEARCRLRKRKVRKLSSKVQDLRPIDSKRIEVERFVYVSLKFLSQVGGPDAIDRIGGRLILQIASRVAADCGRARVLEMLESIAAATVEVCSGQASDNCLNDEGL
jgi:hypothetical protein